MSTSIIMIAIIVVAIIGILILRRSLRRSVADFIPHVTYVDETLLDLVRTRQMRAATDYYQQHAGATPEDAQKAIEYLVRNPDSLMLMVRLQDGNQAPLFMDDTLLGYLEQGRIPKATLYYNQQTGADMRETQIAIFALAANPQMKFKAKKGTSRSDTGGAGIKDLIAAGDIDRAVEVYQEFMGVDEFTARAAVQDMIDSQTD